MHNGIKRMHQQCPWQSMVAIWILAVVVTAEVVLVLLRQVAAQVLAMWMSVATVVVSVVGSRLVAVGARRLLQWMEAAVGSETTVGHLVGR